MDNIKSHLGLNLSSQANSHHSKKSSLTQFNFVIAMGLNYLESPILSSPNIPISINIKKSGEVSIDGISEEVITSKGIQIYSDKKITTSKNQKGE